MDQIKENNINKYFIIILLLVILILGLIGYIVYDKVIMNKDETLEIVDKTKENKEEIKTVITKEEAENFLNELVSDSVSVDLLISNTDEEIFLNSIRYLTLKDKYTKNDNYFIFNQNDIIDLARKYYMKDNFDYIHSDNSFEYDSTNKTYRSLLNFGLFSPGPSFDKTRIIENFNYEADVATVTYQVKVTHDTSQLVTPEDVVNIKNYNIKLVKVNNELRIQSITLE